ncbi:MAG: globin [Novosphingobium sp.]
MSECPVTRFAASIEAVALTGVDIVPLFFERLFERYPEQRDNFQRPAATQGAMVNDMITMLAQFASGSPTARATLHDCLDRHQSYGPIAIEHFTEAWNILLKTCEVVAGGDWSTRFSQLWSNLIPQGGLISR